MRFVRPTRLEIVWLGKLAGDRGLAAYRGHLAERDDGRQKGWIAMRMSAFLLSILGSLAAVVGGLYATNDIHDVVDAVGIIAAVLRAIDRYLPLIALGLIVALEGLLLTVKRRLLLRHFLKEAFTRECMAECTATGRTQADIWR